MIDIRATTCSAIPAGDAKVNSTEKPKTEAAILPLVAILPVLILTNNEFIQPVRLSLQLPPVEGKP
jgi:hypothetical protein